MNHEVVTMWGFWLACHVSPWLSKAKGRTAFLFGTYEIGGVFIPGLLEN